jgi:hypothetical protein
MNDDSVLDGVYQTLLEAYGPERVSRAPAQVSVRLGNRTKAKVTAEGARLMVVLRGRWEFDAAAPDLLERLEDLMEDLMEHLADPGGQTPPSVPYTPGEGR